MCASYGLDPRMGEYKTFLSDHDRAVLDDLAKWAKQNSGKTIRPTGIKERKLLPHIPLSESAPVMEQAWWGYLANDGRPVKFPSINTRSERVKEQPGLLARRGIAPATTWFEMQKPSRDWYQFGTGEVFAIATVTRPGKPEGGDPVNCYSLIMQPARSDLGHIHDRMPLLLPKAFINEWLDPSNEPSRELIEAALDAGREETDRISAGLKSSATVAPPAERLF